MVVLPVSVTVWYRWHYDTKQWKKSASKKMDLEWKNIH